MKIFSLWTEIDFGKYKGQNKKLIHIMNEDFKYVKYLVEKENPINLDQAAKDFYMEKAGVKKYRYSLTGIPKFRGK